MRSLRMVIFPDFSVNIGLCECMMSEEESTHTAGECQGK
jgi:hypothetical protein